MKLKLLRQVILMSKLTFYGLCLQSLLFGLAIAEDGHAQKKKLNEIYVSVKFENTAINKVLKKLENETEFSFSYYKEDVPSNKVVNILATNISMRDLLEEVSKQTKISFKRIDENIYLLPQSKNNASNVEDQISPVLNQQFRISGKVTSLDDGEPLPGVSILVKNTYIGTTTNFEGDFSINASQGDILQFSFIGYKSQEIEVGSQTTINISMQADLEQLEEVVIVGYGAVRKSDLTGAVANVGGEELSNLPSPRVDQLLQGRMAGVNVTSVSGAPGARTSIRIRGGNSISGDNEPLYVIDGFVAGTNFDLNSINVNDIESIDVLKDASSISIYGTRGANGVILVTTKNGSGVGDGKPSVSVGAYTGFQEVARTIDYMNGADRAAWAAEFAEVNGGGNPFAGVTGNTDWQDILTETAPMTNMDVSISGNKEDLNYYFSANYLNQEGIVKNSGLKRYTIRTNLDFRLNQKVRIGTRLNAAIQNSDNNMILFGNINGDINKMLTSYPRFEEDGSFWGQDLIRGGAIDNPEAKVNLNTNQTRNSSILGNFYVEVEPIKGLVIKSTLGPSITWNKNNRFLSGNMPTRAIQGTGGLGAINSSYRIELLQENTISYRKEINENHRFDVLAGFTWQTSDAEGFSAQTQGLPNDPVSFDNLGLGDNTTYVIGSNFPEPFQLVSWIGRANYAFKDRYLLTVSGRVDGSSRFAGSNNEYGFFPSAAFAWRVIDEPFMQNVNFLSDLKLRTSYGSSGNQSIGSLQTQALYRTINFIENDAVGSAVQQSRPSNPDLKWETTDQVDIGLEFGLLDDRLSFEVDYYYKRTNDLLFPRPIASQTGFSSRIENVGSLENRGWEFLVNSVNVATNNFTWTTTLTLAANRSKVLDIGGDVEEEILYNSNIIGPAAKLIVGQPVGVYTGVEYLGTWRDQSQIDQFGYEGRTNVVGGPRFEDTNGDGTLNVDDLKVIGNPEPTFYGGLQNTISYKNITLDFLLQGTFGGDLFNELTAYAYFGLDDNNLYSEVINRWTPQNPDSRIPRAGSIVSNSEIPSNTELVEDGTFVRLKNVRISYDFNTSKIGWLNGLNVFAAGSNLFLISNFRGYDPEAITATGGGFDNVLRGFIRPEYPNARTFTFGFNANF